MLALVLPMVIISYHLKEEKRLLRKEIKHKIIDGIDESQLICLKFTRTQLETKLKWKHSKEFQFNNTMYDIVSKELQNDNVVFYCWEDTEETELNQQLASLLTNEWSKSPYRKKQEKSIGKWTKSLFLPPSTPKHAVFYRYEKKGFTNLNQYQSITLIGSPPPPEFDKFEI